MSINTENLASIIEDAADAVDGTFTSDYSGRGMYGKDCVGVVFEDTGGLVAMGAQIAWCVADRADYSFDMSGVFDAMEDVISDLQNMRMDTMGTGIIVYWPNIQAGGD